MSDLNVGINMLTVSHTETRNRISEAIMGALLLVLVLVVVVSHGCGVCMVRQLQFQKETKEINRKKKRYNQKKERNKNREKESKERNIGTKKERKKRKKER